MIRSKSISILFLAKNSELKIDDTLNARYRALDVEFNFSTITDIKYHLSRLKFEISRSRNHNAAYGLKIKLVDCPHRLNVHRTVYKKQSNLF